MLAHLFATCLLQIIRLAATNFDSLLKQEQLGLSLYVVERSPPYFASQKDVAVAAKSQTIEAKIQAFIPGKLVVVSLYVVFKCYMIFCSSEGIGWHD